MPPDTVAWKIHQRTVHVDSSNDFLSIFNSRASPVLFAPKLGTAWYSTVLADIITISLTSQATETSNDFPVFWSNH